MQDCLRAQPRSTYFFNTSRIFSKIPVITPMCETSHTWDGEFSRSVNSFKIKGFREFPDRLEII
jgi:hypothetical protein